MTNHVTIQGTLPRAPRIVDPSSDDQGLIALFTVACRNGDLGGLNFIEVKAFGYQAELANDRMTDKTKVEVKGYIRSESWTPKGKNAKKQYRQVVVADYIAVLDGGLILEGDEAVA